MTAPELRALPPAGEAPDPHPDAADEAWSRQFAKDPAAGQADAREARAADIGDDYYTDGQIIAGATIAVGVFAVPSGREEAFTAAVADATKPGSKAAWLLDQIELGKAAAEYGIRPSRGLKRLPTWARMVGGLGALAYVIGTAYKLATTGDDASRPAAGPAGAGGVPGAQDRPAEAPSAA